VLLGIEIRRRRRDKTVLFAFVLSALIGNAVICGVLSGPHDRYQSRLIWIVPFAVLLAEPFGRRVSACEAGANPSLNAA
jgi:hypothetical protein